MISGIIKNPTNKINNQKKIIETNKVTVMPLASTAPTRTSQRTPTTMNTATTMGMATIATTTRTPAMTGSLRRRSDQKSRKIQAPK